MMCNLAELRAIEESLLNVAERLRRKRSDMENEIAEAGLREAFCIEEKSLSEREGFIHSAKAFFEGLVAEIERRGKLPEFAVKFLDAVEALLKDCIRPSPNPRGRGEGLSCIICGCREYGQDREVFRHSSACYAYLVGDLLKTWRGGV